MLAEPVPHNLTGLALNATYSIPPLEEGDSLIKPNQLDERSRVPTWVLVPTAHGREPESFRTPADPENTPPLRQYPNRLIQVAVAHYESGSVEHLSVQVDLAAKSAQTVAVGLDLVAVKQPINYSKVDPGLAPTEAKLFDQDRTRLTAVLAK